MSPDEYRFYEVNKVGKCLRLAAIISEDACSINKKSGRIFACSDCPGLGGDEVVNKSCKVIGCEKLVVVKGYCTGHAKQFEPGALEMKNQKVRDQDAKKRELLARVLDVPAPDPIDDVVPDSEIPPPEIIPIDFGKVVNVEGEAEYFGVDPVIYLALREAFDNAMTRYLVDCRAGSRVRLFATLPNRSSLLMVWGIRRIGA